MNKKRIIAFSATMSILFSSFSGAASAAKSYTIDDLCHLRDAIVDLDDITTDDDINNDGKVNVFDLCLLKSSMLTNKECITSDYAATDKNVKLVGRTMRSNDITWLIHSGSAVEFTVTGKWTSDEKVTEMIFPDGTSMSLEGF